MEKILLTASPEVTSKIMTRLNNSKDVANRRATYKQNKEIIDRTSQSLLIRGYDGKKGVKNVDDLHKAAEMGHEGAQGILAQELYEKLMDAQNADTKLILCKDLAEQGLFLLLDGKEQKEFIGRRYGLAYNNKEGALQTFHDLNSQKDSMKKGVWEFYEEKLNEPTPPQGNLNN